jgi:glutamate dehydrogenase (NAD(P)+)
MGAEYRPFLRVVWSDPDGPATGYVVVDRLVCGIATGGLRTRAGCTLAEVEDLAREMSLKAGAYGLPVGGAKGGLDHPADAPDVDEVRMRFVAAVRSLLDSIWVTAGDLGTPQSALDAVFARAGLGPSSLRAALRRSPDRAAVTARVREMFTLVDDGLTMSDLIGGYGVAEAALAGLEGLGLDPTHSRAVVQGFGAMGGSSALYLHRAGVRVVGIADAHGLVHNPVRGLDVPTLLAGRRPGGLIDRAGLRADDAQLPAEAWLDVDAELAVPAATSYSVTEADVGRLRARLVAEAANVPLTPGAEALLVGRGVPVIPDFVANAGAAAWAWWVIFGLVSDAAGSRAMVSASVRPLVRRLMAAWTDDRTDLREHARRLAIETTTELTQRFGSVDERIPLFDAGLLAARTSTRRPVATTDTGRP